MLCNPTVLKYYEFEEDEYISTVLKMLRPKKVILAPKNKKPQRNEEFDELNSI